MLTVNDVRFIISKEEDFILGPGLVTEDLLCSRVLLNWKGIEKASDIDIRRGTESALLTSLYQRNSRDQIANIHWIIEKASEFQKNIYFCFIDYAKAFDCVDHNKLWKIWKRWEYQTTWPASWETYMQVRKQQLELDMEQQTGSK